MVFPSGATSNELHEPSALTQVEPASLESLGCPAALAERRPEPRGCDFRLPIQATSANGSTGFRSFGQVRPVSSLINIVLSVPASTRCGLSGSNIRPSTMIRCPVWTGTHALPPSADLRMPRLVPRRRTAPSRGCTAIAVASPPGNPMRTQVRASSEERKSEPKKVTAYSPRGLVGSGTMDQTPPPSAKIRFPDPAADQVRPPSTLRKTPAGVEASTESALARLA